MKARQSLPGIFDALEAHVEGKVPVDNGDEQNDQDVADRRRERLRWVKQFLIDWSPVLAGLADLVVRHYS
ncbi:hypothetical protein [Streptomyces sp. NPDC047024]|uniref:hypothetical protein n=1 Tax=Streptomyces sp. NPDC047024 TaxID=3155476 RepID=UPI0033CD47F7